ncbi:hypothetical protein [Pseudodesulfovibrio sp. zrk46]|uniref:hypothetical protein n=1 Tax=Pseudodesulfovibrio sp. zrk46 TaxID=2725288 RepID=UPI001449CD5B|nr:hypothetical protein [Pseudodesulfovibrio sp. zrk46]QJB56942.1 hypothetical protein HFN16_11235 [Pseudodesulfovibrio sp. zrk46]
MKIHWEVLKKRGNHRPVLTYEIELEQFEVDLAVPQVVIDTAIAKPPSSWRSYCYPGEDERGGAPMDWYRLMTPSHKKRKVEDKLILSWREPSNEFVDVKAAFERLRTHFELTLKGAHDSAPLELVEHLELTKDTKEHIVCGVASARFLSAVGF